MDFETRGGFWEQEIEKELWYPKVYLSKTSKLI